VGKEMCSGLMLVSRCEIFDLDVAVVSFQEERTLSLYLFQSSEYQQISKWSLVDLPLKILTTFPKKSPTEDEKVMILLIYSEYVSLVSFNMSQKTQLLTKTSPKYLPNHLHAASYVSSCDHFLLSSTDSLSLLSPRQISDTLTLQNLVLKIDSSRKYVNRDSTAFTSILSVSSTRSFVVLISQNILTHLYLFEWCEIDVSSLSVFVIYQAHLPETRTSYSPIPQSDKLAVAYRSHILLYGHSGLFASISLEFVFSSAITALSFVIPRVDQSTQDQRATWSFILSSVDNGIYLIDLGEQDSSCGLLSFRKLREQAGDPFSGWCWNQDQSMLPSKYAPIIPFYTHLLPLLQRSSNDHWSVLVIGSHQTIGSQMIELKLEPESAFKDDPNHLPITNPLPRIASFTGHFDHFCNLTHVMSTSQQHSRGKGSIDSLYGCCSSPLDSTAEDDRSILFRFHLDLTLLPHISCRLDLPFNFKEWPQSHLPHLSTNWGDNRSLRYSF
jgi:hypothetical protein